MNRTLCCYAFARGWRRGDRGVYRVIQLMFGHSLFRKFIEHFYYLHNYQVVKKRLLTKKLHYYYITLNRYYIIFFC
jgi:hypothetical protein